MKKLLMMTLLSIVAFPLFGVSFQVTNTMGNQVSVTIKNRVATDAEHADDAHENAEGEITHYRAGEETLVDSTTIANDATTDFNIPNANQNQLVGEFPAGLEVYQFMVIIEWDDNAEPKETKKLIAIFDIPHFLPHYNINEDGALGITDQSYNELLALIQNMGQQAEEEAEEPNNDAPDNPSAPAA